MNENLSKILQAIEFDAGKRRDWGLLSLAGCYHYGWYETEIDLSKAAHCYERLIAERSSDDYLFDAYIRCSTVLNSLGKTTDSILMAANCFSIDGLAASETTQCLKQLVSLLCDYKANVIPDYSEQKISIVLGGHLTSIAHSGVETEVWADFLYRLGEVASYEEEPQLALSLHEKAILAGDDGTTPWANLAIGCLWMNTDKNPSKLKASRSKAIEAFEKVIEGGGPNRALAVAYWKLAWIEYYGMGIAPTNEYKALELCEKAIEYGEVEQGERLKAEIERFIATRERRLIEDAAEDAYLSFLQSL